IKKLSEGNMKEIIIELLWLFNEEMMQDEDNADAIVYEYAERILDAIDEAPVFLPEEYTEFID
ncbi:MAG: hypothetical protein ACRCX2_08025, partial [Paraclostridium sp.]